MKAFAVLVWAGASVLAGPVGAQTPQTAPASELRTIARGSATEVLVDVVVVDKHGKPIKNLKASDLQIFEDNARQEITSFRYVPPSEMAAQPTAPAQVTPGAPAAAPPAQAGGSHSLHTVNLVCLVFHNLDPETRLRAIDAVKDFLKIEMPPNTYIGMFVLGDRLNPVFPFTPNKQELANALEKSITSQPLDFNQASVAALTANPTEMTIGTVVDTASHSSTTTMNVTGGEVSGSSIAGAEVSTDIGASAMRGARITEARDFSHLTGMRETDKILNMLTQFGKLPGRKMVLLLSTGLATTGDPDRFQQMVAKANAADTTIYSIDVSGLRENSTAQAGKLALGQVAATSRSQGAIGGSLGAAKEKSRQEDTMNDAVRNSDVQASLRALAEDTGGFLIANTNEFRKPFQQIVENMETHYEVMYHPTAQTYDGQLRTIQIKTSHPDWRAESRTGYFAVPDIREFSTLMPQDIVGLAVLASKPLPHAFDFHTGVFSFQSTGGNRKGELVIELPGGSLTPTPNAGKGTDRLHGQMFALIKDSTGQVVDKFSLDAPYEVPDAKLADLRATPLVFTHAIDLPMGKYSVDTVALDREGGRVSTNAIEFDNTGASTGVGMSSALLIRRIEPGQGAEQSGPLSIRGSRLVPFVETNLTLDTKPYAYFVVYPDKGNTAKPKLQVQLRVDDKILADQTSDLPAPDASGAIPMVIRAAVHTGHCELKLTTIQGEETTTRTLAYTVIPN
jgi:VWFA-related protein